MLRGHTPAAPVEAVARVKRGSLKVKREEEEQATVVRIKQPEEQEEASVDTPWAMQAVVVKDEDGDERVVRVEPVHPDSTVPWPEPPAVYPRPEPDPMHGAPRWTDPPAPDPMHGPPQWTEQASGQPVRQEIVVALSPSKEKGTAVCARNYAAVEARLERYGLIDMGRSSGGNQALVVHVRKRNREPLEVLNGIRQGCVLRARRRGRDADLRVRFVTPARYYSPGSKITTLCIGVDQSDWQSLIAAPPRI